MEGFVLNSERKHRTGQLNGSLDKKHMAEGLFLRCGFITSGVDGGFEKMASHIMMIWALNG